MDESIILHKNYSLLDVVKVIMALLVDPIHRRLGSTDICLINLEVNTLARFAVPFFFTCSGFLFFNRNYDLKIRKLKNFIKKNMKIYFIWYILLLPQTIFRYRYTCNLSFKEIVYNIIFNNLRYPLHLWFLPALSLSTIIVFALVRKRELFATVLSIIMIIFSTVFTLKDLSFSNSYFSLLAKTMFIGVPYVYIGFFLSRHDIKISKIKIIVFLSVSIFLSFIWGYLEFVFQSKTPFIENKTTYIPVIIFLMLLCINYSPQKDFSIFRKASMLIYYSHIAIYQEVLYIALDILGLDILIQNRPAILLITLAYTTLFTISVITMENKKGFHWLKRLYN